MASNGSKNGSKKAKADELELYRRILEKLQARLRGDVDQMTEEALHRGGGESGGGNLSRVPVHIADLGTDNFDQEFTLGLIENEQETLDEIQAALERVEAGRFGLCEGCEKPIAKARLQALPYTRYCIECARREEQSGAAY